MPTYNSRSPIQNPGPSTRVRVKVPSWFYDEIAELINTQVAMAAGLFDSLKRLPSKDISQLSLEAQQLIRNYDPANPDHLYSSDTFGKTDKPLLTHGRAKGVPLLAPLDLDSIRGRSVAHGDPEPVVRASDDYVRRLTAGGRVIKELKLYRKYIVGKVVAGDGKTYQSTWSAETGEVLMGVALQRNVAKAWALVFIGPQEIEDYFNSVTLSEAENGAAQK